MLSNVKQTMIVAVLGCLCITLSGCLLLAVGAGAAGSMAYAKGKLVESVKADPPKVVDATEQAFDSLGFILISKESTGMDGKVTGRTGEDTSVTVSVATKGSGISEVSIRFGVLGDEVKSRALMDAIKNNL